ncbi:hypothetical protein Vadar_033422 [Vaccinium darrowii]|uniref:Uncharacterized protein n=1 Tax=Vaccinium darrowii TaxID=229202 RepID=A0ACB7YIB9_9ERIC|nr:hypothetical protein Vadar_033422 [Vaccinium darrowii]
MMHMTLYWGTDLTLLFDWWTTSSWPTYSLSLLACFLFALLYQFLESLRRSPILTTTVVDRPSQPPPSSIATPLLSKSTGRTTHSLRRLAHAALFGVNAAIGYALMLAVMSFNGGVFLSVVLGIFVGYYLFRCGDLESQSNDSAVVDNSCACS